MECSGIKKNRGAPRPCENSASIVDVNGDWWCHSHCEDPVLRAAAREVYEFTHRVLNDYNRNRARKEKRVCVCGKKFGNGERKCRACGTLARRLPTSNKVKFRQAARGLEDRIEQAKCVLHKSKLKVAEPAPAGLCCTEGDCPHKARWIPAA